MMIYAKLIGDNKSQRIKNLWGNNMDYRGNIGIILHNLSDEPFTVNEGERIAQGAIARVEQVEIIEATELSETERGTDGFGSTGL